MLLIDKPPTSPADPDALIEEARRRTRKRRRRIAAVVLVAAGGAAIGTLASGGGSGSTRLGRPHSGGSPQVTFSDGQFSLAGHAIAISAGLGLNAPGAGETLWVSTGFRGMTGNSYDPDSGQRILGEGGSSPPAPGLPGQLIVAVVAPQISAVRAGRLGTFVAHRLPTLPYGEKAAVFYYPRSSLPPGPLLVIGGTPRKKLARELALANSPRERLARERYFKANQPPALTPLTASGRPAPITTIPWSFRPPSAYWHAPAGPAASARCAVRSTATGVTPNWGDVATGLPADKRAAAQALMACLIDWYTWHGAALQVAVLLNARSPGSTPAAIPNSVPLAHGIVRVNSAAARAGDVARRDGQAWILVGGGNNTAQRIQFLNSLHITRLTT